MSCSSSGSSDICPHERVLEHGGLPGAGPGDDFAYDSAPLVVTAYYGVSGVAVDVVSDDVSAPSDRAGERASDSGIADDLRVPESESLDPAVDAPEYATPTS